MNAPPEQSATPPLAERWTALTLSVGTACSAVLLVAGLAWMIIAGRTGEITMLSFWHVIAYAAAGSFAGFVGAILGVGGGFFAVPFMVFGMGLSFHHAAAASIASVVATSSAAAPHSLRRGFANLHLGLALKTSAVVGAVAGSYVVARLGQEHENILSRLFGVLVLSGAYFLWRRAHEQFESLPHDKELGIIGRSYFDTARGEQVSYRPKHVPAALAISIIGGAASSLGLGGGTVSVPVVRLLCGAPMRVATTTSNYLMGAVAATAAFVKYCQGDLVPVVAVPLVLGTLAGSRLGAWVGRFLHGRWLQYAFVVVMVIVAGRMLIGIDRESGNIARGAFATCPPWTHVLKIFLQGQWHSLPAAAMLLLMLTPMLGLLASVAGALAQRAWLLAGTASAALLALVLSIWLAHL